MNHDVRITKDSDGDIKGKHVLIVEDIDTGYTLEKCVIFLNLREPASLTICTLLDKIFSRCEWKCLLKGWF